jgi:RNA polymerase sigma-70 factor (ECF subfamily)
VTADGLGHGEIAEILGIPEGTVWSRLHQARKALAAALK